jgi:LemA protein
MSSLVGVGIALAVLLFWVVGAYNRLVRLRAQAISAFEPLAVQFAQYVSFVRVHFSAPLAHLHPASHDGLSGAAEQFDSSLKVAKIHPLDDMAVRALGTAYEVLTGSWARLRNEPPDLAGHLLPDTLHQQWEHMTLHANQARVEFNRAVQVYNEAIVQFPASMLASLVGFGPAHLI